jgi:hypothetical protein
MSPGRLRPLVHLTLSPDAIARLVEIASRSGESRSAVVDRLIRETEMPRPPGPSSDASRNAAREQEGITGNERRRADNGAEMLRRR